MTQSTSKHDDRPARTEVRIHSEAVFAPMLCSA